MAFRYFLLLLSFLSFVVGAQAQDCTTPVGGANMDLRDSDILLQTFPDGTTVTFVCNVGYVPAGGSGVITCTAGIWSPVRLKCERKNCGSAGEVDHGSIDYSSGTEFGDKIVINCNTGYRLVGKREIGCGDRGWMGRLPICEVVVCDPPATVVDGTLSPQKDEYEYREVVQYSCQKDFTLSGARSLSCSEDGTFKPDPPTCTKVECVEPDIKNAEWIGGSRPPYRYHSTVTYRCLTGYKLVGERTLVCEIDGNWSPALPKCEITVVTCLPPPMVANGSFSPNKGSYEYREVVEYSCQSYFILTGSKSASCSDDGTFKPASPTCTKAPTPTKPPTTTTTTTTTTATPTGNNGSSIAKGVGGFFAALVLCVALYFGCRKAVEKMKGSGKDDADIKAPKADEEVALSDQKGLELIPADGRDAGAPLDSSTAMSEKNNM